MSQSPPDRGPSRLGEVRARAHMGLIRVVALGAVAAALLAVPVALLSLVVAAVREGGGWGVIVGVSLPFLVGGALVARSAWKSAKDEVLVLEGGIEVRGRGTVRMFAWHEVTHVWERWLVRDDAATAEFYFQATGGRLFTIGRALENYIEVGSLASTEVQSRWLGAYRAALAEGTPVSFGPIGLDPRGVTIRDRHLDWSALYSATVEHTAFGMAWRFTPRHETRLSSISVEANLVANARVLAALLAERGFRPTTHEGASRIVYNALAGLTDLPS